ncbi:MAG: inositol-3-phosphate synthase [Solirubrobacterales bacterium]
MNEVRVAVAGVGNCANCLIQGSEFLADQIDNQDLDPTTYGLLTPDVCGYEPGSVRVVLGFDVDERKVGFDLREAMWAEPNVANDFWEIESELGPVLHGPLADGLGKSHAEKVDAVSPTSASAVRFPRLDQAGITDALDEHGIDVLVNFLPVGSEEASRIYARAALEGGVAFVNAIPVWIARDDELKKEFADARVPLIGDDVKSQVGATMLHRAVAEAFSSRGARIDKTYQLNFGGNTDFYNMKDEERLATKRISKTAAVTSVAEVDPAKIHIGPSGFVGFLRDEKIAFIRVEGTGFCGNQLEVEMRYSGQDSPNSAAVVYDAVRWAAAAAQLPAEIPQELLLGPASAWLMKAPRIQMPDREAADRCGALARTKPSGFVMDGDDVVLRAAAEQHGDV